MVIINTKIVQDYKAEDTQALFFWWRQWNGGKIIGLPSREGNISCDSINAKHPTIVAEISNYLILGNDCQELACVIGVDDWHESCMTSQWSKSVIEKLLAPTYAILGFFSVSQYYN